MERTADGTLEGGILGNAALLIHAFQPVAAGLSHVEQRDSCTHFTQHTFYTAPSQAT